MDSCLLLWEETWVLIWTLELEADQENFSLTMREEAGMDPNYLLLCGAMWTQYRSEDAGLELLRALHSEDPDVVSLASAMMEAAVVSA